MMNFPFKTYLLYFFGSLLLISAVLYLTEWSYIPYLYAFACIGTAVLFLISPYKGENFRLKRLNIQQAISALLLPVSAFLMYKGMNEWVVCLLVSAILQVYVIFVHDYEEKKQERNEKNNKPTE